MIAAFVTAAIFLSQTASVVAHGGVTSYKVGSTTYPGWSPYNPPPQTTVERPYTTYDPILNAVATTLGCNNNGASGSNQQDITIAAGTSITAFWSQWTHAEGPVTVYLAQCPGSTCTGFDSNSAKWFKISEAGLLSGTLAKGSWGNGIILSTLKWDATIPASLKPGAYLIRHELLALHQANTPQFYPECGQLIVTGSGSAFPSSDYLVSIPGAWTASDPGVNVNIYSAEAATITTYKVPGPPVWPGSGGSTPGTTTVKPTTVATTVKPTTAVPTTSTQPTGCTVQKYGQCGGQGWTGCTVCVGSTCTKSGDFYSQCL